MSKKILVNAHHHGAFLTLNSIFEAGDVDRLIVIIPNSQVQKYSQFEDKVFVDFEKNMKKFVKKHSPDAEVYVIDDSTDMTRFQRAVSVLEELGETGNWLVLIAGSLYNKAKDWSFDFKFQIAGCATRSFSGPHDMYAMIGLPNDNSMNSEAFFVNMDVANTVGIQKLPSTTFGRTDALIGPALSSVECLKWSASCSIAIACSFWMKSISRNLKPDEYVAYPFDLMVPHAKATKKLLPRGAFEQILKNAEESGWYSDLRTTYL